MVWLWAPGFFTLLILLGHFLQTARALGEDRGVHIIPDDHIQAREILGEEDYWALTAELGNPAVQCARGPVTVTLALETILEVTNATLALNLANRSANLHFHPSEKVVEVELAPREPHQECVLEKTATVTVEIQCPNCVTLSSTVRYTAGHAIVTDLLPQRLMAINPLPAAMRGKHATRFSTQVDKRLLVDGGGRAFTAIFTFLSLEEKKIENFVARLHTLLVNNQAYYTRVSPTGNKATVYASLKLPQNVDADTVPEIVIDVECDGCNEKEVFLTYKPERTGIFSIETDAFYHRFFNRKIIEKPIRGIEVTQEKNVKARSWQFNATAADLCNSIYNGAIVFITANPWSKASFYWQSGGVRYEAAVSQSYEQRLVEWIAKDGQNPCSTADAKVSLYMTCEDCVSADSGVLCLPLEPYVPEGGKKMGDAVLTGSWKKNERCSVSITSSGKKRIMKDGENVQAWVDFPRNSQGSSSNVESAFFYENKEEIRNVLNRWQNVFAANPSHASWSLTGGSKWLCENLKGAVYREVEASF